MLAFIIAAFAGFILSVPTFNSMVSIVGKTYTLNDNETWVVRGLGALLSGITLTIFVILAVIQEISKMSKGS